MLPGAAFLEACQAATRRCCQRTALAGRPGRMTLPGHSRCASAGQWMHVSTFENGRVDGSRVSTAERPHPCESATMFSAMHARRTSPSSSRSSSSGGAAGAEASWTPACATSTARAMCKPASRPRTEMLTIAFGLARRSAAEAAVDVSFRARHCSGCAGELPRRWRDAVRTLWTGRRASAAARPFSRGSRSTRLRSRWARRAPTESAWLASSSRCVQLMAPLPFLLPVAPSPRPTATHAHATRTPFHPSPIQLPSPTTALPTPFP